MNAIVFLGPSLPLPEARAILDATYLPPVAQSELISAVTTHKPDVIGIIDGVFSQSLSVWHKEILFALERGVKVFGASSMGALRAAETEPFGTVGIGKVFEMYRSGELIDDDEVALLHGSHDTGYQKLSEPMVNLRLTFRAAWEKGLIGKKEFDDLVAIAKGLFYPHRTFTNIFDTAARNGLPSETIELIKGFVRSHYVDIKKLDAIELLRTIGELDMNEQSERMDFTLNRTRLFEALYNRDRTVQHNDVDIPLYCIANYAALHVHDFGEVNFNALNRAVVAHLARYFELEASAEETDREIGRFRARFKLREEHAFVAWLRENNLELEEFAELMKTVCLCRRMHAWYMTHLGAEKNTKCFLDELRLKNRYTKVAEQAAGEEKLIRDHYPHFKELYHSELSTREILIKHLTRTGIPMDIPWDEWCKEAGFHDAADFKIALLRSYLVDEFMNDLFDKL
jgi:hypothetical protein